MKYIKHLMVAALILASMFELQAQFTLSGQFRNRAEYRDGYKTLPTANSNDYWLVAQRTRLTFDYATEKFIIKATVQDARIWGEDKWKADNMGIGLYEGYGIYNFNEALSLQVGRQEIAYDDARLFTNGDWRTYGETHDAARLMYKNKGFTAIAGFSVNNNPSAELDAFGTNYDLRASQYKNMTHLWLNQKLMDDALNISFIAVYDGHQKADGVDTAGNAVYYPQDILYRTTVGPYIKFMKGMIGLEGAFYYQTGTNSMEKTINANFYNVLATVKPVKGLAVMVGYDHYSGTNFDPENPSAEDNTFNTLTGPGHKYLGFMDYFGIPSNHKAGINDLLVRLEYGFNKKKNKVQATYHNFMLDQGFLASGTAVDKALGSEVDLVFVHKFSKHVNLKAGYSFLLPTESMEKLKKVTPGTSEFAQFGWIQLEFNPMFFTTK